MQSFKRLLIPLTHTFILLPVCAAVSGAPAFPKLAFLFLILFLFSAVGWAVDAFVPQEFPVWITIPVLLGFGVAIGCFFLPDILLPVLRKSTEIISRTDKLKIGIVMGIAAGIIMIWSAVECRRGMRKALAPYKVGLGLVLYMGTYFFYRAEGSYMDAQMNDLFQPIFIFGAIWLIIGIIILNSGFIEKMAESKTQPRAPQSVRLNNMLFSLLFCVIVLLISSIGSIRNAAAGLIRRFALWIASIFANSEEYEQGGGGSSGDLGLGDEWMSSNVSELSRKITTVVVTILTVAILAFLLWIIGKKAFAAIRNLKSRFKDKIDTLQNTAAYEEEETILDSKHLFAELGARMQGRRKRIPRYEDMQDNRSRIRWLYRRLVESMKKKQTFIASQTPNENALQIGDNPELAAVASNYSIARYSDHEISDESVAAGRSAIRKIKG